MTGHVDLSKPLIEQPEDKDLKSNVDQDEPKTNLQNASEIKEVENSSKGSSKNCRKLLLNL